MNAGEKVAYLKGLLDARPIEDAAQSAWVRAALDVLESLAAENAELRKRLEEQGGTLDELYNFCEELDADLSDVESRFDLAAEDDFDENAPSDSDDGFYEAVCPHCGLHFFCSESMIDSNGAVNCPDCGESVTVRESMPDDDEND